MNAKLGSLATLINNQNHDEEKRAGKHSETHGHRHLLEQTHTSVLIIRNSIITALLGNTTYHKHSALRVLCDVQVRFVGGN